MKLFLINFIIMFIVSCWFINFLKKQRKKEVILIDIDSLVDVEPIIERGKIFVANKDNVTLEDYFAAHVSEQLPIPSGILKAIQYQNLGYTLTFFSCRPEYLRTETAKILNDWNLRGELYMNQYKSTDYDFRQGLAFELIQVQNKKIVGVIDHSAIAKKVFYGK